MPNLYLPLRSDNMEYLEYREETFPYETWYDHYNDFIDFCLPLHWHSAFEIIILLSGSLDYCVSGKHYPLQPGDGLFVNTNRLHYTKCRQPSECADVFGIVFQPNLLGYSPENVCFKKYIKPVLDSRIDAVKIDPGTERGSKILNGITALKNADSSNYFYEIKVLSVLTSLWHDLLNGYFFSAEIKTNMPQQHEQEVRDILSYMHAHFQERITIEILLSLTCISRREVFRSFKALTNMSPIEFLNDYRLSIAADLLCHSNHNVTEILSRCGFNSASYFVKMFKKKYGMPPLQYQKYEKKKYGR